MSANATVVTAKRTRQCPGQAGHGTKVPALQGLARTAKPGNVCLKISSRKWPANCTHLLLEWEVIARSHQNDVSLSQNPAYRFVRQVLCLIFALHLAAGVANELSELTQLVRVEVANCPIGGAGLVPVGDLIALVGR